MALMPGYDTRSAADVAHQVAQERLQQQAQEIQQEQFAAGMQQRDQELALQAFQAQQTAEIRRMEQDRLREAHAQEVAFRALRNAVDLGVKFDPASKTWRPLTEEDAEYTPWKETQAERKLKLPLTPDQQVELARRKTIAVGKAQEPFLIRAGERKKEATYETMGRQAQIDQAKAQQRFNDRMKEFQASQIHQSLREAARADEQLKRVELQIKAAKERQRIAINAQKALGAMGFLKTAVGAAGKKAEEDDKRRESRYNKALTRERVAANDVSRLTKLMNDQEKKLWPQFQQMTRNYSWWEGAPELEDIAEPGYYQTQWNLMMQPYRRAVQEAQQRYTDAREASIKARDEWLVPGGAQQPTRRQSQPSSTVKRMPNADEFKQLLQASGGDVRRAWEMWQTQQSPAGKL
jgi:hypothetical protein